MRLPSLALLIFFVPFLVRAQDAGTGPSPERELFILPVKEAGIVTPNGNLYEVDGGVYLDAEAMFVVSRELVVLRAENESLKKTPVLTPAPASPAGILIALALGLVVGAGGATYLFLRR